MAPPNSFIHISDFESPEKLADYLRFLQNNPGIFSHYHMLINMEGSFLKVLGDHT